MNAEEIKNRLTELGMTVGDAPAPAANYVPVVQTGSLVFVSGQVCAKLDGTMLKGTLGDDASLEDGVEAAQICGVNILLQMAAHLQKTGGRIKQCVKLGGFVNSTPAFDQHPKIINGCSDLMVAVLGDAGKHARFALGVANLPFGLMVEIDAIFEVH